MSLSKESNFGRASLALVDNFFGRESAGGVDRIGTEDINLLVDEGLVAKARVDDDDENL